MTHEEGHLDDTRELPPVISLEEELNYQVGRAAALMAAAEEGDIAYKLGDAAIVVGEEQQSLGGAIWQGVKRALPFTSSRTEKLHTIIDIQHEGALQQHQEYEVETSLGDWLSFVAPGDRPNLKIVDAVYGDPYLSPLRIEVEGHPWPSFELGHHFAFNFTDSDLADLPQSVRERLEDRKAFWNGLGVENGAALEEFIDEHLEKIRVAFDGSELPEELDWLAAVDTTAFDQLRAMQQETGREMQFLRLKKAPEATIEDVLRIAINTQEKYISTWLPAWVQREKTPVILDSDVQSMREAHEAISTSFQSGRKTKLSDFRRAYLMSDLDRKLAQDGDFDASLENMQNLRSIVLGIEMDGPCDENQKEILDRANVLLDQELSGEKVADRLIIDTVLHTSEGIKQVLKLITVLVPGAWGLENAPINAISESAKAVGSGDDLVGEVGEIKSLHAQGYKWGELMRRFGVIIPVAVGAVALGTQVERIGETHSERLAAILYATTTFITSAATLGLTTRSFAQGYEKLAAQGKLVDQPYLDHETRLKMRAAITETEGSEAVSVAIAEFMDALSENSNVSEKDIRKRVQAIEAAARAGKLDQALSHVTPTKSEAYGAAYREVFGVNPVREGKLWAMPAMLGAASLLGGTLLSSPLFYVPFGMGEALGGLGYAKYQDIREGSRWRAKVDRYTQEALASQQ